MKDEVSIYLISKDRFEELRSGAIKKCTIKHSTYIWNVFVIPLRDGVYNVISEHLEVYDGVMGTGEDDQYYKIEEEVDENWIHVQTGKKLEDFTEVK